MASCFEMSAEDNDQARRGEWKKRFEVAAEKRTRQLSGLWWQQLEPDLVPLATLEQATERLEFECQDWVSFHTYTDHCDMKRYAITAGLQLFASLVLDTKRKMPPPEALVRDVLKRLDEMQTRSPTLVVASEGSMKKDAAAKARAWWWPESIIQ